MNRIWVLTILWSALALVSCGKRDKSVKIEAQYLPYYAHFMSNVAAVGGSAQVSDLTIKKGDTGNDRILATCQVISESEADDQKTTTKTIIVSPAFNGLTEAQRTALLGHELGHCIFGKSHLDDVCSNGNAQSMMNKYLISNYSGTAFQNCYTAKLVGGDTATFCKYDPCNYATPEQADLALTNDKNR